MNSNSSSACETPGFWLAASWMACRDIVRKCLVGGEEGTRKFSELAIITAALARVQTLAHHHLKHAPLSTTRAGRLLFTSSHQRTPFIVQCTPLQQAEIIIAANALYCSIYHKYCQDRRQVISSTSICSSSSSSVSSSFSSFCSVVTTPSLHLKGHLLPSTFFQHSS